MVNLPVSLVQLGHVACRSGGNLHLRILVNILLDCEELLAQVVYLLGCLLHLVAVL